MKHLISVIYLHMYWSKLKNISFYFFSRGNSNTETTIRYPRFGNYFGVIATLARSLCIGSVIQTNIPNHQLFLWSRKALLKGIKSDDVDSCAVRPVKLNYILHKIRFNRKWKQNCTFRNNFLAHFRMRRVNKIAQSLCHQCCLSIL